MIKCTLSNKWSWQKFQTVVRLWIHLISETSFHIFFLQSHMKD